MAIRSWIDSKKHWDDFAQYEAEINRVIDNYKLLVLCTYSIDKCDANEIIDVVTNHQFALIKRNAKWELIESASHKKIEEALRQSEKRYQILANASHEGIAMIDSGRFVDVNKQFTEKFGYTEKELIGTNVELLLPEFERKDVMNQFKQKNELEIEHKGLHKNGKTLTLITHVKKMTYRGHEVYMATVHDITERKEAEEILRKSEEKYRIIVETANEGVWITDKQHKSFLVNQRMADMLGYTIDEILGRTQKDFLATDIDQQKICLEILNKIKNGYSTKQELKLKRKDGSDLWVIASASPVFNNNKELENMVAMLVDISDRRKKEEELQILNRTIRAISNGRKAMLHAKSEMEYLNEICKIVVDVCGYAMVWIGYTEGESKNVIPVAYSGFEKGYLEQLNITWANTDRGQGPTGTAIRTGKIAICEDMHTDPKFLPWRKEAIKRGYASSLVLPLKNDNKTLGAITIYSEKPRGFCKKEIELFIDLAADLSYGIMSLRIRELNELSRRKIQHLASFPELNPSPILETDKNGKITFVNKATYSFLEKFDNRNKIDLFLPKDFSEIIKSLHYLKRDKTYFREIKINDHIFAEEINLLYKLQVTRIYARDITKRREIKDALERSEKRYYSLFNEMRAANALYQIICNKQGKPIDCIILDVNPAHEKLIGIKKYNIIGKLYTELFPHEKVDWELFGKVALGGKSVHFVKYSHVWKRYFDMLIFSPTKGQFAVMRIDITKRKKIELENEELYQKLHTEQQRKDEFIAIMGHELRNPLAAISTSIQLQQEYMQSKENDQMLDKSELEIFKEVAEISSNQVNNMSRLLDDMLDVSRIAQGKILLKKKIFDIKIAINEAINNISQKNELNNRTLTVVIPKINILVKGDQVRIQQIIINLLSNAVRYTKNKGKIWLKVKIKNGFVNVSVKDDGLGIPTDKLSLIFEPFYRLKNAKKKSIDGMGVGLMIVKKLVELHHGEIKAKSKGLQKGSEFILSLPIIKHYKKEQKMDKTSEKNETETRSRKKILVVDDNEKIVNMIVKLLSLKGYDVRFANNGSTAINIAKEFRPEVVVLDIGLPGKDGYQIARLLRKDVSERKEKLQIIGVSGYGQEQDIKKSIEAGFDEYLVKPIEISQLIDVINKNSEDNK